MGQPGQPDSTGKITIAQNHHRPRPFGSFFDQFRRLQPYRCFGDIAGGPPLSEIFATMPK